MDSLLLKSFIPEIFLSLTILYLLLFNGYITTALKFNFPLIERELFFQIFFILLFLFLLVLKVKIEGIFSNFFLINDLAAIQIKTVFIFFIFFIFILIWQSYLFQNLNFFEFFILFLFSLFASLLLISCYDLFIAYLILELQALSFYVLAGIKRNSTLSNEAALKYFITGSFFSCIFLFGIALIYAGFGTTNFFFINLLSILYLNNSFFYLNLLSILGCFFILITIFFKLAIVPFHFWVPDVYDGSPLSSTIIFSLMPKLVLFTFLIRFLLIFFLSIQNFDSFFFFLGLLSIIWGTLQSLKQKRLKKLIIYSSIAQIGFVLLALSIFSEDSLSSIFFFLIIYNFASILSWGFLTSAFIFKKHIYFFNIEKKYPLYLSDLINLFYLNKSWAFIFLILFFSMAGLPPFAGFLSKFYIFFSLINSFNISFLIFLMLIISVSAFYYLRVLKIIFFETTKNKNNLFQGNFNFLYKDFYFFCLCSCLFLLLYLFFFPNVLLLNSKHLFFGFFKL